MNNRELGYYWARYTCMNCLEPFDMKVVFGSSIPTFIDADRFTKLPEMLKKYHLPAPECRYCGCNNWTHGKAVK